MKRKIIIFLNIFLILFGTFLVVHELFFVEKPDYERAIRMVITIGIVICTNVTGIKKDNKYFRDSCKKVYGNILQNTFKDDSKKYSELIKSLKKYSYGNNKASINRLKKLLDKCDTDRERAVVTFFIGTNNMELDKMATATYYIKKSISFDSSIMEAHNNLAVCYQMDGKVDKSIKILKAALEQFPKEVILLANLSYGYIIKEEWDSALELSREILLYDENNLKAFEYAYLASVRLGSENKAEYYKDMYLSNGGVEGNLETELKKCANRRLK